MGRVSKQEHEERLAETEQALVRLRSSYRVEQHLAKKFGVDERTARKWMAAVRKRWREAAVEVDRQAHRDELAATLNEVIFQAMNKSFIVKNEDGTVVLDANPNSPTFGKPVVKANPDLQRVLHAVSQLRSMFGTDSPTVTKVQVSPDLESMPDVSKMGPEGAKAMEAWLKTIAPSGDIAALAGEWFTFDGPTSQPVEAATDPTEPPEDK